MVTVKEYNEMVKALAKDGEEIRSDLTATDAHIIHMIMGVAGEVGELLDAIKKAVMYRKRMDRANVVEELGDIEFYLEGLRQGLEIDRQEVLSANYNKLNKRYSSGSYSNDQAQARADKNENVT